MDVEELIAELKSEAFSVQDIIGPQGFSPKLYEALRRVPRHRFIPLAYQDLAYANRAVPIGYGQTVSQPFIVALMTHLVEPSPEQRVLEIGTGSGYQTAVLSQLLGEVYSVEVVPALAQQARKILADLACDNVHLNVADGYDGWPAHAPYDGIIVTAGATRPPPALIRQLKLGGKLVIPLGDNVNEQQLVVIKKTGAGERDVLRRPIIPVRFVPFVGKINEHAR